MIPTACIFNIQRYSLHDGGGIRSIVFFKGCPFTCPWCCNPESLSSKPQLFYKKNLCIKCSINENGNCEKAADDCPSGAKEIIGKQQSVDEVYDIIKNDQPFYEASNGGITLSGGECLLQYEFSIALLKKCKENHIHTAIESTLALPLKKLSELVEVVDLFLVDFKIMDEQISTALLKLDVSQMKSNVKRILELGAQVIARVPLIPQYTSTPKNLNHLIKVLKELHIKEVHLLPFHQLGEAKYQSIELDYKCSNLEPMSEIQLTEIEQLFKQSGFLCKIHGN